MRTVSYGVYGDIYRDNKTQELVEVMPPGPPATMFYLDVHGKVHSIFPPTFQQNFSPVIAVEDRPGFKTALRNGFGMPINRRREKWWRRLIRRMLNDSEFQPWSATFVDVH